MTGRGLEFAAIALILGGSAPLPASAQTDLRCDQRPIQHATRSVSDGGEARLPAFTVTVYDYAHVGEHDIADAERVVDRIYRRAGVAIEWLNACDAAGAIGLQLNILPKAMTVRTTVTEAAMGFALAGTRTAIVLYDRISQLAMSERVGSRTLLACVIAHELGHLLLGPNAHTPSGIMQPHFDPRIPCPGSLSFSPDQAATIARTIPSRTS